LTKPTLQVDWGDAERRGSEVGLEVRQALLVVQIAESRAYGEHSGYNETNDEHNEAELMELAISRRWSPFRGPVVADRRSPRHGWGPDGLFRWWRQRFLEGHLFDLRHVTNRITLNAAPFSLLCSRAQVPLSAGRTRRTVALFGTTRLSEFGISHVSDDVVLLQFLRGNSELKRAITVLKTRGSAHDPRIRQFEITSKGLSLGDQFLPGQSLL